MSRIFHWLFMWKMDPISGFDICLVFTLPPRDSTLQYKRCVHFWNNFHCITNYEYRAENFKMVDIEINACSSLFLNIKTNLISYLYPKTCKKFNQSESRIYRLILKPVFDFSLTISKKEWFKKKIKSVSIEYSD